MKTHNFIVFEGLDGSGKSSLAKMLAAHLGYEYHKTPEGSFQQARTFFDLPEIPSVERISYYTADCIKLSVMVKTGEIPFLVLDRYYYSTIAYHQEQAPELLNYFQPFFSALAKPDLVILLDVDFEVSKKRILARSNQPSYEDKFLRNEDFENIYQNYLDCIDVPILKVTNSGSLEDSLEIITRYLSNPTHSLSSK
jgi:thymidylate kinase